MSENEKKLIPENAKLVFEGVIFKVYQWEQELYDGSKATFERAVRPHSVEVIATVGDKILFTEQEQPHRRDPFLALPGGRVDDGEEPQRAAHRELLEETGYDSEDISLWKLFEDTGSILWSRYIFVAKNCHRVHDGDPDAGEKIRTRLISFEELLMLSENKNFRCKGRLKEELYYLRLHPEAQEEFKKFLFS